MNTEAAQAKLRKRTKSKERERKKEQKRKPFTTLIEGLETATMKYTQKTIAPLTTEAELVQQTDIADAQPTLWIGTKQWKANSSAQSMGIKAGDTIRMC